MFDLPETGGVFYPCPPRRLNDGTKIGNDVGSGEDVSASMILLDAGPVVARFEEHEWMVNSSLEKFGAALELVGAAGRASEDEWTEAELDRVERGLRQIDLTAYDAENSYWASITEQMRHQLF